MVITKEFEELSPIVNGVPVEGFLSGKFWAENGVIKSIELHACQIMKDGKMIQPSPVILDRPWRNTGSRANILFHFFEAAILDHYSWEVEQTAKVEPTPVRNINEYL